MQTAENGAGSERLASSPDSFSLCQSANVCRVAVVGGGSCTHTQRSCFFFLRDFSGTAMAQKAYFAGGKICVCKQNPLNGLMGAKKEQAVSQLGNDAQECTHIHACNTHALAYTLALSPRKDTDTVSLLRSREGLRKLTRVTTRGEKPSAKSRNANLSSHRDATEVQVVFFLVHVQERFIVLSQMCVVNGNYR